MAQAERRKAGETYEQRQNFGDNGTLACPRQFLPGSREHLLMANQGGDHEVVSLGSGSPGTRRLHPAAANHDHNDNEHHNNHRSAAASPSRTSRRFGTT
jgi:hypothetical protein